MLALQSYEQSNGFAVMTADELYYVNGGSSSFNASVYYDSISNWGAEMHYESDKRIFDAKVICVDGNVTGDITIIKK